MVRFVLITVFLASASSSAETLPLKFENSVDNQPLGEQGSGPVLRLRKDLRLTSRPNDGRLSFIFFRDGAQVHEPSVLMDDKQTSCGFAVVYGDRDFERMLDYKRGALPAFILKAGTFRLKRTHVSAHGTADEALAGRLPIVYVDFQVNPSPNGPFAEGAPLTYVNGHQSGSRVISFACRGSDIRVGDVSQALSLALGRVDTALSP